MPSEIFFKKSNKGASGLGIAQNHLHKGMHIDEKGCFYITRTGL